LRRRPPASEAEHADHELSVVATQPPATAPAPAEVSAPPYQPEPQAAAQASTVGAIMTNEDASTTIESTREPTATQATGNSQAEAAPSTVSAVDRTRDELLSAARSSSWDVAAPQGQGQNDELRRRFTSSTN